MSMFIVFVDFFFFIYSNYGVSCFPVSCCIIWCYLQRIAMGPRKEDIKMIANYASKANPEKQLPLFVWVPVDDTVPPTHYIMIAYDTLFLCLGGVLGMI